MSAGLEVRLVELLSGRPNELVRAMQRTLEKLKAAAEHDLYDAPMLEPDLLPALAAGPHEAGLSLQEMSC